MLEDVYNLDSMSYDDLLELSEDLLIPVSELLNIQQSGE